MDPVTAITTITTVIETAIKLEPQIIQGLNNLKIFGAALYQAFTGNAISADDQTTLEATIDNLYSQIVVPLPPAQPGDPDYIAPT